MSCSSSVLCRCILPGRGAFLCVGFVYSDPLELNKRPGIFCQFIHIGNLPDHILRQPVHGDDLVRLQTPSLLTLQNTALRVDRAVKRMESAGPYGVFKNSISLLVPCGMDFEQMTSITSADIPHQ